MEPAVHVTELVKRYPGRPTNAVDGISFTVERGEVFGLLGPNGAGKTTTIGVLTTRVLPTSGQARVAGVDVAADPVTARSRLSVVPQRSNLDRALTARQNLVFHAAYHGIGRAERNRRADALLEQLGLRGRGADKVDNYSGGMAQRLLIARALMHAPQVIFLDEPSTGLDPQARLFVWDQVRELRGGGVTVVLTTHDMDEAAALTDRVGIMDSGRPGGRQGGGARRGRRARRARHRAAGGGGARAPGRRVRRAGQEGLRRPGLLAPQGVGSLGRGGEEARDTDCAHRGDGRVAARRQEGALPTHRCRVPTGGRESTPRAPGRSRAGSPRARSGCRARSPRSAPASCARARAGGRPGWSPDRRR